jgi:hypothetical protein
VPHGGCPRGDGAGLRRADAALAERSGPLPNWGGGRCLTSHEGCPRGRGGLVATWGLPSRDGRAGYRMGAALAGGDGSAVVWRLPSRGWGGLALHGGCPYGMGRACCRMEVVFLGGLPLRDGTCLVPHRDWPSRGWGGLAPCGGCPRWRGGLALHGGCPCVMGRAYVAWGLLLRDGFVSRRRAGCCRVGAALRGMGRAG